ncbi:NusG domain II-containing protein [Niallia sp. Sow4_A1]|uniref:NusG domain II-containing protein n=1 Tax=Bacillaceae TaxID=186817 RepID=UPI0004E2570A|nr:MULTISPECIES: NusG domain II-containing protein [Bacillaceae]MCM3362424.1 NusG domain II-containing protein [Niallia sp. MER TA 168]
MRKYSKMIKPFDIIMVVILLVISFVPMAVFAMNQSKEEEGNKVIAIITQDGKVIREVDLTGHTENEQFMIKGKGKQYNLIEVENEQIRIKEDNSPDQIGVKMGWKGIPGQTIICLPHKVLIEIVAEKPEAMEEDGLILSH